jgi:aryl-alcohol dehydrogenase-like predicted oxidoreductase
MFEYCVKHNIKVTTYQSIERGLLTNRVLDGLNLAENDLRKKKPEFNDICQQEIGKWVKEYIYPIAQQHGVSILSLVIAWTLKNQPVSTTVCGISKEKYFKDYLDAAALNISDETINLINSAYLSLQNTILEKYGKDIKAFLGV